MRILWIKNTLLHPLNDGGRIKTYLILRELRKKHHITYLYLSYPGEPQKNRDKAVEYATQILPINWQPTKIFSPAFYLKEIPRIFIPFPYAVWTYRSDKMKTAILELGHKEANDILICDQLGPALNVPPNIGIPTILHQHNAESLLWERHYRQENDSIKKLYLYVEWKKMIRTERELCNKFDSVIAASTLEADYFREHFHLRKIYSIPTPVDVCYFRSSSETIDSNTLIFIGAMDWLPNRDAVNYFVKNIFPLIKRGKPNAKLLIVGKNPSREIIALSKLHSGSIKVTGTVPDVRPYMQKASVFIVPIRIAGGTRLKIYEAMAMSKPIVSTSIGAEGLTYCHKKNIFIADEPENFAKYCMKLLNSKKLSQQIGTEARKLVLKYFNCSIVSNNFEKILYKNVNNLHSSGKSME